MGEGTPRWLIQFYRLRKQVPSRPHTLHFCLLQSRRTPERIECRTPKEISPFALGMKAPPPYCPGPVRPHPVLADINDNRAKTRHLGSCRAWIAQSAFPWKRQALPGALVKAAHTSSEQWPPTLLWSTAPYWAGPGLSVPDIAALKSLTALTNHGRKTHFSASWCGHPWKMPVLTWPLACPQSKHLEPAKAY